MGPAARLSDGGAELCRGALASSPSRWASASSAGAGNSARSGADDSAIGAASAARASVLMRSTIERNPFERCGVRCSRKPSCSNSATASVSRISRGVLARIDREQDGDQAAHDVRVAVADEGQHRARRAVRLDVVASQTWLAQPCTLLASRAVAFGKRRERAAELDDIAIAIVPLVEQGEIVDDLVDRRSCRMPATAVCCRSTEPYMRTAPAKARRIRRFIGRGCHTGAGLSLSRRPRSARICRRAGRASRCRGRPSSACPARRTRLVASLGAADRSRSGPDFLSVRNLVDLGARPAPVADHGRGLRRPRKHPADARRTGSCRRPPRRRPITASIVADLRHFGVVGASSPSAAGPARASARMPFAKERT